MIDLSMTYSKRQKKSSHLQPTIRMNKITTDRHVAYRNAHEKRLLPSVCFNVH